MTWVPRNNGFVVGELYESIDIMPHPNTNTYNGFPDFLFRSRGRLRQKPNEKYDKRNDEQDVD